MQNEPSLIILNRPRSKKRGLTINRNGRITLRTQPIKLLKLEKGDSIIFACLDQQMYIIKSNEYDAVHLYGRKGQLHGCSANTVRCLLINIRGVPHYANEVDLVVSDKLETINLYGKEYKALAVVNRADLSHCR